MLRPAYFAPSAPQALIEHAAHGFRHGLHGFPFVVVKTY
jgi:hypothetical protein